MCRLCGKARSRRTPRMHEVHYAWFAYLSIVSFVGRRERCDLAFPQMSADQFTKLSGVCVAKQGHEEHHGCTKYTTLSLHTSASCPLSVVVSVVTLPSRR